MAPTVIQIIYDQGLFHLPKGRRKVKFNDVWLHRFSALDTEFILNTNEDMKKGQMMFLCLDNHLFLILPEGQIENIFNLSGCYSTLSETGVNYKIYSFLIQTDVWDK